MLLGKAFPIGSSKCDTDPCPFWTNTAVFWWNQTHTDSETKKNAVILKAEPNFKKSFCTPLVWCVISC